MQEPILVQEPLENSEFQQNIINTTQKYFKCDYNNFDFPAKDTCYFNLYLGVFKVQIVVTPKTSYLPKSSKGYVYYGNYTWERNVKDDSFEDTCKKINEFLKEKVKQMKAGLVE